VEPVVSDFLHGASFSGLQDCRNPVVQLRSLSACDHLFHPRAKRPVLKEEESSVFAQCAILEETTEDGAELCYGLTEDLSRKLR
jgi:hypothetical protein